jgi:hypothetical protein
MMPNIRSFTPILAIALLLPSPVQPRAQDAAAIPPITSITELKETVLLPAFSSPIPAGQNAVWCATFQICWDQLTSDILKEPIEISGAEDLVKRLNATPYSKDQLPEDSAYSAVGFVEKGILATIEKEMKRLFPNVLPDLGAPSAGIVAYGYLRAGAKFDLPFVTQENMRYKDSIGRETSVKSFGLGVKDMFTSPALRKQIRVLFDKSPYDAQDEFGVDLCSSSKPNQVILAKLQKKRSLAETWLEVQARITSPRKNFSERFGPNEVLLIPEVSFSLNRHFGELEGADRTFKNLGFRGKYISRACQSIEFVLDRGGAQVDSEAMVRVRPLPRVFVLDGPFMIILRKRDSEFPYFAMWVDNSEVMRAKVEK